MILRTSTGRGFRGYVEYVVTHKSEDGQHEHVHTLRVKAARKPSGKPRKDVAGARIKG